MPLSKRDWKIIDHWDEKQKEAAKHPDIKMQQSHLSARRKEIRMELEYIVRSFNKLMKKGCVELDENGEYESVL